MNRPAPKVNSGVPWWLWGMMIPIAAAVVFGVFATSSPEDPEKTYTDMRDTLIAREGTRKLAREAIAKLEKVEGYENRAVLLKALLDANLNRHPRSLEKLAQIVDDPELRPLVLQRMAFSHMLTGDYTGAETDYKSALEAGDDATKEKVMLDLATMYSNIGAFELSIETANKALETNPDSRDLKLLLGSAYTVLQQYEKAVEQFKTVLVTQGEFSSAVPARVNHYVESLIRSGNVDQLKEIWSNCSSVIGEPLLRTEAMLTVNDEELMRSELRDFKAAGGEGEGGLIVATRVARIDQDLTTARESLVGALNGLHRSRMVLDEAKAFYGETFEASKLAAVEENLKLVEGFNEELVAALGAISRDTANPEGRMEVGRVLMKLGDFPGARRWFSTAAALDATYKDKGREFAEGFLPTFQILVGIPGDVERRESAPTGVPSSIAAPEGSSTEDAASEGEDSEEPAADGDKEPAEDPAAKPDDASEKATGDDPASAEGEKAADPEPEGSVPESSVPESSEKPAKSDE